MKAMAKRLDALETPAGGLPACAKAWLGWPLSDAERAEAEALPASGAIDTSMWSKEAKAWLGVD